MAQRRPARELLRSLVADASDLPDPWQPGDGSGARPEDPLEWPGYPQRLVDTRADVGTDESVVAVRGTIKGAAAVVVAWEFAFLGGSMGLEAGERIAAAYDEARRHNLPVVLLPSTGGARMQEGMVALVQMAKTSVAADAHAAAGLLQVAVLRDPTTGGVFASHVNLADVVLAQEEATIGFAGPRVAEALTDGPLPEGSHTAEGAVAAGLADAVVDDDGLRDRLAAIVGWGHDAGVDGTEGVAAAAAGGGPSATEQVAAAPEPAGDEDTGEEAGPAWREVLRARADDRPRASSFLGHLDVAFELRGDRAGGDDPTIRVVLARLAGRRVVVVALDREAPTGGRVTPAGYRKAWRGFHLAGRLGVPLVTLVDTPGADASASSEAGGIAHHIAATFRRLLAVTAPTVAVVIGEGGSGGALALSVADRLLIQEHAVFSVIAPEGAAAILRRDRSAAPEVAELLRPTAHDLERFGVADAVVAEPPGGEVAAVWEAVEMSLAELDAVSDDERVDRRSRRWRRAGNPRWAGGR